MKNSISCKGKFTVEHIRNGEVIAKHNFANGITNEGKNALLDVMFEGGTVSQLTSWFMGLIDNTNFTALAAGDTYDNIDQAGNGWDELQAYTEATRPEWTADAAASQSITNSAQVVFNMNATNTVKGLFIVAGASAATKGDHTAGTAHKLWATALFDQGDTAVVSGDQLKVTYTVSA